MPSTRDIRRRIRSVGSTAQITKAMQMVAASKMRKAQEAALAGRPFVRMIYRFSVQRPLHTSEFSPPASGSSPDTKAGRDPSRCG